MAAEKQHALPVFRDVFEITEYLLSNEQFGILMRSYFEYSESGTVYSGDDPAIKMAFGFMANQYDRYIAAAAAKSEHRSINGKKGGRPPKANESEEKLNKAKKANESKEKLEKHPLLSSPLHSYPILNNSNTSSDDDGVHPDADVFDRFWAAYPKKVGKEAARKAFKKVISKTDISLLIKAIETQKQSKQWKEQNGQFIPNPSTWLNQGRWDDVLEPEAAVNQNHWDDPHYYDNPLFGGG